MYNLGYLLCKDDDSIAIIHDKEYTFKDINKLANSFAAGLFKNGVSKGTHVAIMADNSSMLICAYLGVLRLGAVAVLISTKLPENIIQYIIKDSGSVILLTSRNFEDYIDENGSYESPSVDVTDPAFMLYTAGSTGKPKGVIIPHNHLWTVKQKADDKVMSKARMLVAAPCYHMNGLSNVEVGLASGATVILMSKFETKKALKLIEMHKVNFIPSVPSMIAMLLDDLDNSDISSLKVISMASAPVSTFLYNNIKSKLPNVYINIAYGSTEAGPGLFSRHPTLPTPEMSVGYPASGIDYRLVEGVLQIKSPSMMLKYNNISTKFTDDGYYITNDLFRVDENGFYYFLGRADDMFVCGGDNIYPRNLEIILEQHPSVKESAVIGIEDSIKGMKPYAFVSITKKVNLEELETICTENLPPNSRPRKIWIIDQMPYNSVHKPDKAKLKLIAEEKLEHI